MKLLLSLLLIAFCVPGTALAENQVITLKDGSQVKGELVGINNGVYTIKTPLMGEITVNSDQVAGINAQGFQPAQAQSSGQPSAAADPVLGQKMQDMQNQLMSNPQMLAQIQQLAEDPEIVQIMSDPAFMQAVTAKDISAIQGNPRTQELMNNPKMQAFIEQLRGSEGISSSDKNSGQ